MEEVDVVDVKDWLEGFKKEKFLDKLDVKKVNELLSASDYKERNVVIVNQMIESVRDYISERPIFYFRVRFEMEDKFDKKKKPALHNVTKNLDWIKEILTIFLNFFGEYPWAVFWDKEYMKITKEKENSIQLTDDDIEKELSVVYKKYYRESLKNDVLKSIQGLLKRIEQLLNSESVKNVDSTRKSLKTTDKKNARNLAKLDKLAAQSFKKSNMFYRETLQHHLYKYLGGEESLGDNLEQVVSTFNTIISQIYDSLSFLNMIPAKVTNKIEKLCDELIDVQNDHKKQREDFIKSKKEQGARTVILGSVVQDLDKCITLMEKIYKELGITTKLLIGKVKDIKNETLALPKFLTDIQKRSYPNTTKLLWWEKP